MMKKPAWLTKREVINACIVLAAIGGLGLLVYRPSWTGFGPDSTKSTERNVAGQTTKTIEVEQSGKTLWDWLSVLGVPLSLAILGFWFQQQQQKRTDEQSKLEREIATANQHEEALQSYFDRLSALLVDKNLIAVAAKLKKADKTKEEDTAIDEQRELLRAAVDVIHARTLSILRQFGVDGNRKTSVIRFLMEAEVIGKLELSLRTADLSGVTLRFAKFNGVDFFFANLQDSNFQGANFQGANLRGANLCGAYLSQAKFDGANLSYAKLTTAKRWTEAQLSSAKLCRTELPEGCDLDPNRDCKELGISTD